jgi:hypothetical protein
MPEGAVRMTEIRYTLGPVRHEPFFGNPEVLVRIAEDMRHSVVFLGHKDSRPGYGGIDCIGTGFLLEYDGAPYFVTAKHLADSEEFKNRPFLIRLNKRDGTSHNLPVSKLNWFHHPDPTVDVSVVLFLVPASAGYECAYLPPQFVITDEKLERYDIGVGSLTYTVGLFRLLSGEKRNLPITYMGNIAMLPCDEKIPVIDWTDPNGERIIHVEAYLVAAQSLDGMSGSPVFVRPEVDLNFSKSMVGPEIAEKAICGPHTQIQLLGLWQGSWTARPDEIMAANHGDEITVPVGTGIVVPYQKIVEVLEMEEAKEARNLFIKSRRPTAARIDARRSPRSSADISVSDVNPNHLEDFSRLVDVASRKRPRDDQP